MHGHGRENSSNGVDSKSESSDKSDKQPESGSTTTADAGDPVAAALTNGSNGGHVPPPPPPPVVLAVEAAAKGSERQAPVLESLPERQEKPPLMERFSFGLGRKKSSRFLR